MYKKEESLPIGADGLRSTKKVKIREGDDGQGSQVDSESVEVEMAETEGAVSYRNKLLNIDNKGQGVTRERDKANLIIKLLGKMIRYEDLVKSVAVLWQPKCSYQVVDVEGGFYFVSFDLEEHYTKVFTGGPWMVFGANLTMQPWSISFDPETSMISKVVAWVLVSGLYFRYYHKNTVRATGKLLGEVFKIDYMMGARGCGKYTQIAVLVDLMNPLVQRIKVDRKANVVLKRACHSFALDVGTMGILEINVRMVSYVSPWISCSPCI